MSSTRNHAHCDECIARQEPPSQPIITRIVPSQSERTDGILTTETVEHASRRFRADGALIIEDIVDTDLIAEARRAFGQAYSQYMDDCGHDDALSVGDRRLIITINLEPPFNNPQLFANPYVLPVLEAALDDGFVLGAFGIVCSLASAPAQHRHADGGFLFPRSGIDRLLPASAITVGIPLLEMNDVHGTTALWLGSHRDATRVPDEEGIKPIVREGSCMLWDFRLSHCGTPNQSAVPRPLIYATYCRPWFLDHLNYGKSNPKQKPILAKNDFWLGLSEQHQRLLTRAQEGFYQLNHNLDT
jgi:ectoine hydroxylase-related dioxygenase (phytanoyl-CoA dioxygenase family)